jgi:plastocyanin
MQGPVEQELAVPPLEPGTYYFVCQTHQSMQGTLIAE